MSCTPGDVSKMTLSFAALLIAAAACLAAWRGSPAAEAAPVASRAAELDYGYAVTWDPNSSTLYALAWKKSTGEATVYGGKNGVGMTRRDGLPANPVK